MSRRLQAIAELSGMLSEGIEIAKEGMTDANSPLEVIAVAQHVRRCEALRDIIECIEAQTDEEWEASHPEPARH